MARLKQSLSAAMERGAGDLGDSLRPLAAGRSDNAGTPDGAPEEGRRKGPRNTAVSFTAEEYEFIKTVFEQKAYGMKAATGIKMAALFVADRLDRGLVTMTRAGIAERR